MNCDEIIDELLDTEACCAGGTGTDACGETKGLDSESESNSHISRHRERLVALTAGGQARQYLGRAYTVDQIDSLNDVEVEKLYVRYEARLGAAMTKTLGSAALQLYAGVASMFLPIPAEKQPALIADLEGDPFVGHALSSATCELYHRYGMFLAPLTAALATMKHCQFGHQCPVRVTSINNDGDGGEFTTSHDRVSRGDSTKSIRKSDGADS